MPTLQIPLRHSASFAHALLEVSLQFPAPSQAFKLGQEASSFPIDRLVHVPMEPAMSQAWQSPVQLVLQQTLSTQLPLAQRLPSVPHPAPGHNPQVPPQSLSVSVPFLTPSSQLMQV